MGFVSLNDVDKHSLKDLNKMYKKYYENGFYKLLKLGDINLNFKNAEGLKIYDYDGNEYLDVISSFGCMSLGHNNKDILQAIIDHSSYPNILQQGINIFNGILANDLAYLTDYNLTRCHFTNCGTETVEEALKLSLMYKKDSTHIIYFDKAYHGKTIGSLAVLGNKLKNKYNVMKECFHEVCYGDIEEVIAVCDMYKVSCIIIEPIQGEGGVRIADKDFLKELRAVCNEKDIVLIFDEIQTGLGRCGEIFAYKIFDVVPDIMCLSKTLSGGYVPIGAMMVRESIWKKTYGKMNNGRLLGTTFSGNTLACVAAIKTLSIIQEENLLSRVKDMGSYAMKKLLKLEDKYELITEVRGVGLLIGIDFGELKKLYNEKVIMAFMSTIISKLLNEHRILCTVTSNSPSVLRFEPAFTVEKDDIDYFVDSLDKVLEERDSILALAKETGKLMMKNTLENQ